MPGFPIHHQLPELAQAHIHRAGDSIQPSCPLSSPSPPAFNLPQHQGVSQWVSSFHQGAKVLEFQSQYVPVMTIQKWFPLGLTFFLSPCSPRNFQESSLMPQFKNISSGEESRWWRNRTGDHFLFYKFIERTTERWTKFTKQLLIASSGHQVPRKAAHCLRRESSNTPLLFLNFHFHHTITLPKKKEEREKPSFQTELHIYF